MYWLDGVPSVFQEAFLSRLTETGATESSSIYSCSNEMEGNRQRVCEKTNDTVRNILAEIDCLWHLKDGLHAAVLNNIPEDGNSQKALGISYLTFVIALSLSSVVYGSFCQVLAGKRHQGIWLQKLEI